MKKTILAVLSLLFCFTVFLCASEREFTDLYSDSDIADLKRFAEKGDKSAQYELSLVYGLQNDPANSLRWLTKSAENGYAKAINSLGHMYFKGYGVKQNYYEALKWLKASKESKYEDPDVDEMIAECKSRIDEMISVESKKTSGEKKKNDTQVNNSKNAKSVKSQEI